MSLDISSPSIVYGKFSFHLLILFLIVLEKVNQSMGLIDKIIRQFF